MNEQIREIIDQHQPSVVSGSHVERYGPVAIAKMMQAHTNATLSELEEKVKLLEENAKLFDSDYKMSDETQEFKNAVLQLITEMKADDAK